MPNDNCFECDTVLNKVFCCCSSLWYDEYESKLKLVNDDLTRQLDIVFVLRRLRLHGFALNFLSLETNIK
jgi:hypothetical protein